MTPEQRQRIRDAVRERYRSVARSGAGLFRYPTGRQGALLLGYQAEMVRALPDRVVRSFCGVGNPLGVGLVPEACSLLDIGCGSGLDVIIAARLVGPKGKVYGVDISEEMLAQARRNLEETGTVNAEVTCLDDDFLPYDDQVFDLVISNGACNLFPDKALLFREIYRVLKPGGRLRFADIVMQQGGQSSPYTDVASWAN